MKNYLLFNADPDRKFDTGESVGTLGDHLEYLDDFGGSPDCWDAIEATSRTNAMMQAVESGLHLYVVDETLLRVVGEVNKPQRELRQ